MKFTQCTCDGWKKYIHLIDAALMISASHPQLVKSYPAEGIFKFCPWCGTRREKKHV